MKGAIRIIFRGIVLFVSILTTAALPILIGVKNHAVHLYWNSFFVEISNYLHGMITGYAFIYILGQNPHSFFRIFGVIYIYLHFISSLLLSLVLLLVQY